MFYNNNIEEISEDLIAYDLPIDFFGTEIYPTYPSVLNSGKIAFIFTFATHKMLGYSCPNPYLHLGHHRFLVKEIGTVMAQLLIDNARDIREVLDHAFDYSSDAYLVDIVPTSGPYDPLIFHPKKCQQLEYKNIPPTYLPPSGTLLKSIL